MSTGDSPPGSGPVVDTTQPPAAPPPPRSGGWSELQAQFREWRAAVDRRLPPWWHKALVATAIMVGVLLPFAFSHASNFMDATITPSPCGHGAGAELVVGFAGLLDLGYVAFYAIGSYAPAGSAPDSSLRPMPMSG